MHLMSFRAHFQHWTFIKYDLYILPSISYCVIIISLHLYSTATIQRLWFFTLIIRRITLIQKPPIRSWMLPYFARLWLPSRGAFGRPLVFKGERADGCIEFFFFCWETTTSPILPLLGLPIDSRLILIKAYNCLPSKSFDKPPLHRGGHARFLLNTMAIGISLLLSKVHPSSSLTQGCTNFDKDTNLHKEPSFTSSTFLLLLLNKAWDG